MWNDTAMLHDGATSTQNDMELRTGGEFTINHLNRFQFYLFLGVTGGIIGIIALLFVCICFAIRHRRYEKRMRRWEERRLYTSAPISSALYRQHRYNSNHKRWDDQDCAS